MCARNEVSAGLPSLEFLGIAKHIISGATNIHFSVQEKRLSLATTFGSFEQHSKVVPPSPGEEEGKDGSTDELLAALRKRLRESEKTIGKLRNEVGEIKKDKDASDEALRQCRAENHELRMQLAATSAPTLNGGPGFGFEVEEKERLADHVAELEQERIVLSGMYRSASKRCAMLEQRMAARAHAALKMAICPQNPAVPDDQSCNEFEGGAEEDMCDGGELWDAPEQDESREVDRWRRGDWGDNSGGGVLNFRDLTFINLPLEQCRQLVNQSSTKLRVEAWVIQHARKSSLGEYWHDPELEGGCDSSSACSSSSSHGGPLLSISSSDDSGKRAKECEVEKGEGSGRKPHENTLRKEINSYTGRNMQVRANPMTGGVTRAAWKTGSFATPRRQPDSQVQGIFTSLLSGVGVDKTSTLLPASVVSFGT